MKTVLISVVDGYADVWAGDYVKVFTNRAKKVAMDGTIELVLPRENVMMPGTPTVDQVIDTVKKAVKQAGAGSTLVFNVGHGAVTNATSNDAWVDLSPNGVFKLGDLNTANSFVNVFYDMAIPRPGLVPKSDLDFDKGSNPKPQRLKNWEKYQELAQAIKGAQLRKVVFLTCRIGNSLDFLRKISLDFGTVCEAYRRKVQLTPQTSNRVRVHLQGDGVDSGTNIAANEENLMVGVTSSDQVLVGPPLP